MSGEECDLEKYSMEGEFWHKGVLYRDPYLRPEYFQILEEWRADPSDVILAAYPKTGSTWMSAILSYIFHDGNIEQANAGGDLHMRIPFIENKYPTNVGPIGAQKVDALSPPRLAKTHLGFDMVRRQVEQDKAKFVVVFRNPKDTIVSYFHFYKIYKNTSSFQGDFHEFFRLVKAKRLRYGDIFDWSAGWWSQIHRHNVLPIKYEDMKKDIVNVVRKVAAFCGKDFSDDVIAAIVKASSLKEMKNNPSTNLQSLDILNQSVSNFYRKGQVGDWMNFMSPEEVAFMDEKSKTMLQPIGLTYDDGV